MIQAIITYMIIGAAVALAISRALNKFRRKKVPENKINYQKESFTVQHNCSDCSAECMLRNASHPMIKENVELCIKIENRGKL
jgi:hypothetical protein